MGGSGLTEAVRDLVTGGGTATFASAAAVTVGAVTTELGLEQALVDWSADSLQSDDADHARRVLRGMVLALAEAARHGLPTPASGWNRWSAP
ncbi:MAG: hypothetical protein ACR2G2_17950 [Pseudonocardia sp.]